MQAPVDRPMVVVAGAGSGKTETMAARVAGWWPTSSSPPRPSWASPSPARPPASSAPASACGSPPWPPTPTPTPTCAPASRWPPRPWPPTTGTPPASSPSTACASASSRAPGSSGRPCAGAGRHRRRRAHRRHGRRRTRLVSTTEDVLQLAAELGEHDVTPTSCAPGPPAAGPGARLPVRSHEGSLRRGAEDARPAAGRVALLPMVEAFEARKRAAGAIDYADQVASAARVATSSPDVGRRERARWRVVLLDEYQDTSVGQLRMLEALFGGASRHPVLAVGDPRQSIYGWRGASSGTIERFPRTFPGAPDRPAARLTLSTSWRNDHAVLAVANGSPPTCPSRPAPPRCPTWSRPRRPAPVRSGSGCTRPWPRRPQPWPTGWLPSGTARAGPRARPGPRWPCSPAAVPSCPASPPPCASAACPSRWSAWAACSTSPRSPTSSPPSPCSSTRRPGTPSAGCSPVRAGGSVPATSPRSRPAPAPGARPSPGAGRGRRGRPVTGSRTGPRARARQHRRGARRPRRADGLLGRGPPPDAPAGRRADRAARPAGEPLPDLVDEVVRVLGLETELASHPDTSPGGARAHLDALHRSPASSPTWPSCRRCRRSWATWPTPRSASAASSRVRSR